MGISTCWLIAAISVPNMSCAGRSCAIGLTLFIEKTVNCEPTTVNGYIFVLRRIIPMLKAAMLWGLSSWDKIRGLV